MSRTAILATVLAAAPAATNAEPAHEPPPQVAVLIGPGLRKAWMHSDFRSHDQSLGALSATIAYRVSPHLALGLHAGAARSGDEVQLPGNRTSEFERWDVIAVDLAIAVSYEEGRFAVTPWLGRHASRFHQDEQYCVYQMSMGTCRDEHVTEWTNDFTSYGLTASVVLVRGVPLAAFVDLQTGTGGAVLGPQGEPRVSYSAATFGVAYWR